MGMFATSNTRKKRLFTPPGILISAGNRGGSIHKFLSIFSVCGLGARKEGPWSPVVKLGSSADVGGYAAEFKM